MATWRAFTLLLLAPVPGCASDGTGPGIPDTIAPQVVSLAPNDGASEVGVGSVVTATFSEPISAASVTPGSFTLTPSVAGTVAVSGATATFTPAAPFAYGTLYTAALSSDIRDLAGNRLSAPRTWRFTTVVNRSPTARAGADQDVGLGATVTLDGRGSSDPENELLTYAWTQVAGPPVGALTGSQPSFTAPAAVSALVFELVVTDASGNASSADDVMVHVLENPAAALWVAAGGDDAAPGTRAAPKRTLGAAVTAAAPTGADLYLAAGTYDGTLVLASGVSVYGGYDTAWRRDPTGSVTTLRAVAPLVAPDVVAVTGTAVSDLTLDGLSIVSGPPPTAGGSASGVQFTNSSGVVLRDLVIQVGAGADGSPGPAGAAGTAGGSGAPGGNGSCDGASPGSGGGGGAPAGPLAGTAGGSGGQGGGQGANPGFAGQQGGGAVLPAGAGGAGGAGGNPGAPGANGTAGLSGGIGTDGSGGSGWSVVAGSIVAGAGSSGAPGEPGKGGGGGGGGGGQGCPLCAPGSGNGGGGGGAGGGAGGGGTGGGPGGGSFGVVLLNSTVTLTQSVIATAGGGRGGAGGNGGVGGAGGAGAPGGMSCTTEVGAGGRGGDGGAGGRGGHGGGGAGGPSIGVARLGSTVLTASGNQISAGPGGLGGASAGIGGQAGASLPTY